MLDLAWTPLQFTSPTLVSRAAEQLGRSNDLVDSCNSVLLSVSEQNFPAIANVNQLYFYQIYYTTDFADGRPESVLFVRVSCALAAHVKRFVHG